MVAMVAMVALVVMVAMVDTVEPVEAAYRGSQTFIQCKGSDPVSLVSDGHAGAIGGLQDGHS